MAITCSNMQHQSLRFIISSLFIILTVKLSEAYDPIFGTELQLIHRNNLLGRHQLSISERIQQMFYRDMIRMESIRRLSRNLEEEGHTIGKRRLKQQGAQTAVKSIRSGSSEGSGEYFAKIMVGTPPVELLVVVDTGSDLTWVDCKYKRMKSSAKVVFDADNSKTFQTTSCSSLSCSGELSNLFSLRCRKGNDPCTYNYSYYAGASSAKGVFAYETVTFNLIKGKHAALKNTLVGCTGSTLGLDSFIAGANGILGLSNTKFSLPMQASKLFGYMFSYCLVDMFSDKSISSKLFLGPPPARPNKHSQMQSTKLELKAFGTFYGVYIQSIFIDGKKAFSVSKGGMGAILDSGMTFTALAEAAYKPVMNSLRKSLQKFTRTRGPESVPFEYCYNSEGFDESSAPWIEIGFGDGAKLGVPASSYLGAVLGDNGKNLTCLTFANAENGVSIIGNLVQQGHLWEFDVGKGKLNFAESDCVY